MKKLIKYPLTETDNIVFLSDLHLGHDQEFLWGKRGFNSVEEHDEYIYRFLHEYITPETIIFNLGDTCFNDADMRKITRLSTIECKAHYLLWGNHNSGALGKFKELCKEQTGIDGVEVYPTKFNNISFVGNDVDLQIGKKKRIVLSHFPKKIWDHVGRGSWHLNGHSHGSDLSRLPHAKEGKTLDVGIESAMTYDKYSILFSYRDIVTIMKQKNFESHDHHDNSTVYGG